MKTLAIGAAMALAVSGAAQATPVQWTSASGGNDHWYELVESSGTWAQARAAALSMTHLGETGYLATVLTEAEHLFLRDSVNTSPLYVFLGGTDELEEGRWVWADGPEAGQQFWSGGPAGTGYSFVDWNSGEPNDLGGEDYLGAWSTGPVRWNDVSGATGLPAFIVEYGGTLAADVPLPAAAPMLAAALGGLAFLRRRRAAA